MSGDNYTYTLYGNLAYSIAVYAAESLEDTQNGVPSMVMVDGDDPPADCCDFLSVYIEEAVPYNLGEFPEELFEQARGFHCKDLRWAITYQLKLARPCRPSMNMTGSRLNPFPREQDRQTNGMAIMEDVEALLRHVTAAYDCGELFRPLGFDKRTQPPVMWREISTEGKADCSFVRWEMVFGIE